VDVAVIDLRESIEDGQRVGKHVIEARELGGWREIARGTTIGCRRLHRITMRSLRELRVRVEECTAPARALDIRAYPPA
jgi:alpha-L-fucosidase